jgi:hypothetical protein
VESGDNPHFAAWDWKNQLPKSVEELSTYPHAPWITAEFAAELGRGDASLRHLSTGAGIVPISPTRCARIIHKVGGLSTENGRLSPADVERDVLVSAHTLVKESRTYYASVWGDAD